MLFDVQTERRVLASMLLEPDVLEQCADVSLESVQDPRHQLVLTALRDLQARGMDCGFASSMFLAALRAPAIDWRFLADMTCAFRPYRGESVLLGADLGWLDCLSQRRAAL